MICQGSDHNIARTKIVGEINELYDWNHFIPLEPAKLNERIQQVLLGWTLMVDDLYDAKLLALSKTLLYSVSRIDQLEKLLPVLLAAKNGIIANPDFGLRAFVLRALGACFVAKKTKYLDVKRFYFCLHYFFENGLIDISTRSALHPIFIYVLYITPFDPDLARYIASLNPEIIQPTPEENSPLGVLFTNQASLDDHDVQIAHFLLQLGCDPGESILSTNFGVQTKTPVLVQAARGRHVRFLTVVVPFLRQEHLFLTDSIGLSPYYYLMLTPDDFSKEITSAFRHSRDGLPPEIMFYLEGNYRERLLTQAEHTNNLRIFIQAWESHKTDDNKVALTQATLAVLLRYPLLFDATNHADLKTLIQNVLKEVPCPGYLVREIISSLYQVNNLRQNLAEKLIVEVIDELDSHVVVLDPIEIIRRSRVFSPQNPCIIDALHRHQPDDLIHQYASEGRVVELSYLHKIGGWMSLRTIKAFIFKRPELLDVISMHAAAYRDVIDGVLYMEAQKKGRYDIASVFSIVCGAQIFIKLHDHFKYLKNEHLGLDDVHFTKLIIRETKNLRDRSLGQLTRPPYIFDGDFLSRVSADFLHFWDDQSPPYESFAERLEAFPYKGVINFLQSQMNVWKQFQQDPRMAQFPLQEIWRYAIDYYNQRNGPCGFDQEPGYLNSFLHGMAFALASAKDPKTPDWYIELHSRVVDRCQFPAKRGVFYSSHLDKWNGAYPHFLPYKKKLRTDCIEWGVAALDKDLAGMHDLRLNRFWTLRDDIMRCDSNPHRRVAEIEIKQQLETVMDYYVHLLLNAESRAHRLIIALGFARELEINHYFHDANGRTTHLTFLSLIAGMPDLPFCLFPDANVFDANGPESLAYRYLEACINFKLGGYYRGYKASNDQKSLSTLDLSSYPDLAELRDALLPLVQGKYWQHVTPLLTLQKSQGINVCP